MSGHFTHMSDLYEDMNGKSVTYCPEPKTYKRFLLPLTYGVVFVLGLALNGTLLHLVCSRTKSWSCSVIYLVNLALADLLYALTLPLLIVTYAMGDVWLFGDAACKVVRFLFYTNLHCSMMFLMCISVHRFLSVCHPIRAMVYKTKRVAAFASAAVWILVTTELLPTLVFTQTGIIDNITVCFDITSPGHFHHYLAYGLFLILVGFFVPLLVISICYGSMIRTLFRTHDNIQVRQEIRSKSARTIITVCLLFVICFVPYHITKTVYLFVRTFLVSDCRVLNFVILAYKLSRPIVSFNSCVNPILYFTSSKRHLRQLLPGLFKKRVHPCAFTMQAKVDNDHEDANSD